MTLDEYQNAAAATAIYPDQGSFEGLKYCALKLNGEAGEVADHVGKAMRDDGGKLTEARHKQLIKEAGDNLWYLAMLAFELGVTLDYIARVNITKLEDRKARGVIHGSGSDR